MVNKMFAYFNVNDNVIYQKLVVYSSMSSSSSSSSSPILLFLVYGRLEVMAGISPSPWTNELRYINNGCQSSPQLKLNYHSRFWNNRRNMCSLEIIVSLSLYQLLMDYLDGIASPIRWSKYLRTTFLSCFKSLLVNSVSISRKGRLGGGPLGSSLFSIGLTETKMPSRWSWATASRFFRASNPNESANLRINE